MNETNSINDSLDSSRFKQRFRASSTKEARQTNTTLHYVDVEGRYVEEWPATGVLYEVLYDADTDSVVCVKTLHQSKSVLS